MALSSQQIAEFSREMGAWLLDVEAEAVAALGSAGRNDRGETRQSLFVTPPRLSGSVLSGAVGASAPHAAYVHEGRRPGKRPPIAALKPWVERKLGLAGQDAERVAFLTARAIGRRGLRGTPFLREPAERLAPTLPRRLARAAERAAAQAFPPQTV